MLQELNMNNDLSYIVERTAPPPYRPFRRLGVRCNVTGYPTYDT